VKKEQEKRHVEAEFDVNNRAIGSSGPVEPRPLQ
jgi:hypothetical protein